MTDMTGVVFQGVMTKLILTDVFDGYGLIMTKGEKWIFLS
jgi:hypothetical protein